jgi:hypothetical protein
VYQTAPIYFIFEDKPLCPYIFLMEGFSMKDLERHRICPYGRPFGEYFFFEDESPRYNSFSIE